MNAVTRIITLGVFAALNSGPAFSQSISFQADITQALGEATPTLTWDTTPLADSCIGSGDWSGEKGGTGSETQPTTTSSRTYTLTCTWLAGPVTLTWTAPTENTDGTPLTDLAGFRIYYGSQPSGPYDQQTGDIGAAESSYQITLPAGGWYFVATAFNAAGVESEYSGEAFRLVADDTTVETVAVTVNPRPKAPTGLSAN